jgi:hypothetical protein
MADEQKVPTPGEVVEPQAQITEAPVVVEGVADVEHSDYFQREDETQAQYNERVPVGLQPVKAAITHSYLGKEL